MPRFSWLALSAWARAYGSMCPGAFDFYGYGQVSLTNSGYQSGGQGTQTEIVYDTAASGSISLTLNDRAYFGDVCTSSAYSNERYSSVKLLGKRMRYTTMLAGSDCGCNVAMYLVSMRRNNKSSSCGDFYCDANKVCGVECTEIDIQEANMYSWHSTLHSASDKAGMGAGYGGGDGWNGPRDFTSDEYGPGARCIDTKEPFQVTASFPAGADGSLIAMEVELTQEGKGCPLTMRVENYAGMAELSVELWRGMTPVLSYWKSKEMLWMDGKGPDGLGPCKMDTAQCEGKSQFYDFSVENLPGARVVEPQGARATPAPLPQQPSQGIMQSAPAPTSGGQILPGTLPAHPGDSVPMDDQLHSCTETGEDCRNTHCCKSPGMQCFEKNQWWAECKEACVKGFVGGPQDTAWSCRQLGQRTPDGRKQGLMMLSVAKQEVLPKGSEVIVVTSGGDKQLLAKVIEKEAKGKGIRGNATPGVQPSSSSGIAAQLAERAGNGHLKQELDGALANKTTTSGPPSLHA